MRGLGLRTWRAVAGLLALIGAAIAPAAQAQAQTPVAGYHSAWEATLAWGMSPAQAQATYALSNYRPLPNGDLVVTLLRGRDAAGGLGPHLAPPPGVQPAADHAVAGIGYDLVFEANARLRRIDFAQPARTAAPLQALGEPTLIWSWRNADGTQALAEFVWRMRPDQVARVILLTEGADPAPTPVYAGLAHAPSGGSVRALRHDSSAPRLLGRTLADLAAAGQVLVDDALGTPAAPPAASPPPPVSPAPPVAAPAPRPPGPATIRIRTATYGANCNPLDTMSPDMTATVARACDGKRECEFAPARELVPNHSPTCRPKLFRSTFVCVEADGYAGPVNAIETPATGDATEYAVRYSCAGG